MVQLLQNLKNSNEIERNKILSSLTTNYIPGSLGIHPTYSISNQSNFTSESIEENLQKSNHDHKKIFCVRAVNESIKMGEPAIYGPSSIYIPNMKVSENEENKIDFEKFHNKNIIELIENFFIWWEKIIIKYAAIPIYVVINVLYLKPLINAL